MGARCSHLLLYSILGVIVTTSSDLTVEYSNMRDKSVAFVFSPNYAIPTMMVKVNNNYGYYMSVNASMGTAVICFKANGTWGEEKSII